MSRGIELVPLYVWGLPVEEREFFQASAPYASAGAYVNFMTEEEGDRVAAAYGSNYDRLVQIEKQYDPENIFHLNQNIQNIKP
jgi:Berberine and berberine like